jgi:hypothetical protein
VTPYVRVILIFPFKPAGKKPPTLTPGDGVVLVDVGAYVP